ncbi:hypothetical protein [Candidatus Poriferisodalis sp.]|uniref:hypothetical protein n=1 Tax=Candidatus Poriferisodalis sp. TaxID=3101277 RepID=UPI003B01639A
MPALAVIAQPASAHRQTAQRCDYDPISGQSFNCRQVPVSHVHPPNHYSPPPDTSPTTTQPPSTTQPPPTTQPVPTIPPPSDTSPPDTTPLQVPNHYSPPPDTSPRPPVQPPNHYSPPPDTSPRPDPENDESETDEEAAESEELDGEEGDDDSCPSGTFVSGNCDSRAEDSPAGSDAEPAADDDETGEAGEGDEGVSEEGEHSAEDPCVAWLDSTRDALHNLDPDGSPSITPAPDGCGERTDVLEALGNLLRRVVESHADAAEGERQATEVAYDELREAIKKAWNYEIPGFEHVEPYLDAANDYLACAAVVAAFIKTKGKAAKVPGWKAVVGGLGCEAAITALEIDESDPDSEHGDSNQQGSQQSNVPPQPELDDETTEQTVRPVQTPDTTTQTEPADGDSDDQQGGVDNGDTNSEADSPPTTAPPVAVGSVTGLGGSADGNSVWLGWNAPTTGPAPTAYRVLRTALGGNEQEVARVGGNAYFDSNVQSGVTYTYRIQAISGTLAGPVSASTNVTIP